MSEETLDQISARLQELVDFHSAGGPLHKELATLHQGLTDVTHTVGKGGPVEKAFQGIGEDLARASKERRIHAKQLAAVAKTAHYTMLLSIVSVGAAVYSARQNHQNVQRLVKQNVALRSHQTDRAEHLEKLLRQHDTKMSQGMSRTTQVFEQTKQGLDRLQKLGNEDAFH